MSWVGKLLYKVLSKRPRYDGLVIRQQRGFRRPPLLRLARPFRPLTPFRGSHGTATSVRLSTRTHRHTHRDTHTHRSTHVDRKSSSPNTFIGNSIIRLTCVVDPAGPEFGVVTRQKGREYYNGQVAHGVPVRSVCSPEAAKSGK